MVMPGQGGMRSWKVVVRGVSWLVITVLLLATMGCNDGKSQAAGPVIPTPSAQPEPSTASPPSKLYLASGPIVVENQLDLAALREGVISHIAADTGAPVRKGELLASLDDRQLSAQHEAEEAKTRSIGFDEKNWEAKLKMDEVDFERAQKMKEAQIIPQEQLDHARFQLAATRNELERERQDLVRAQAELHALELEMEKTRVTAPFDGIVARRYVRVGQKVSVGDRLFWLTATGPLRVKFTLPERFIGRTRPGVRVLVIGPDSGATERQARIIQVSPVVDPSSNTIEILAEVEGPVGDLRPGMTVSIRAANLP